MILAVQQTNQNNCRQNKMCSLEVFVRHNDKETCSFRCDCYFSDPCLIDFLFLDETEAELCEIDIPEEYNYTKLN